MAKWFKVMWIAIMIAHVSSIVYMIAVVTEYFQYSLDFYSRLLLFFGLGITFVLLAMSVAAVWFPSTRANPIMNYAVGILIMLGLLLMMKVYISNDGSNDLPSNVDLSLLPHSTVSTTNTNPSLIHIDL